VASRYIFNLENKPAELPERASLPQVC